MILLRKAVIKIAIILSVILIVSLALISIKRLKDFKFNTRSLSRIAVIAAISIVLYMIKLVPFPQGGGFSLLSVLPIMVLSILFGMEEAILAAVIVAGLKITIIPPIHPWQLLLDYFGSMIALGFTPVFGTDKRTEIILGASLAGLLSVTFSVLSGGIFFGQFAPEGMNIWKYSIFYNFLGYGTEVLLSIIVLNILPIKKFKKIFKR